jgi:hypothetical protein
MLFRWTSPSLLTAVDYLNPPIAIPDDDGHMLWILDLSPSNPFLKPNRVFCFVKRNESLFDPSRF